MILSQTQKGGSILVFRCPLGISFKFPIMTTDNLICGSSHSAVWQKKVCWNLQFVKRKVTTKALFLSKNNLLVLNNKTIIVALDMS